MSVGDISAGPNTLEFDTSSCSSPHMLHVSGDVFVVVYDANTPGTAKTFTVDVDGNIGAAVLDTLVFDANGSVPKIIHVSGSIYAVAYSKSDTDGFLKTFSISAVGIFSAVLDTLEFDTATASDIDFIHISGQIFAIVYSGAASDGFIVTVDIDSLGAIANSVVDSLEYDGNLGQDNSIVQVSGTVYAIAHRGGAGDRLFIHTVGITNSGTLSAVANLNVLEIQTDVFPDLTKIGGTTYAVGYRVSGTLRLATISISDDGLTIALIETKQLASAIPTNAGGDILKVGDDLYIMAYSEATTFDGFLIAFQVFISGVILTPVLDTLEFDTTQGGSASLALIPLSDSRYVIAYQGPATDGFAKTTRGTVDRSGVYWTEGTDFHYFDENSVERTMTGTAVDNPVNAEVLSWIE